MSGEVMSLSEKQNHLSEPVRWKEELGDYISFISHSPVDGAVLVGSLSGQSLCLDPHNGEVRFTLPAHLMGVAAGGWSRNGDALATFGHDNVLRIAPTANPSEVKTIDVEGWPSALAWSPTDDVVAVASGKMLSIFDTAGQLVACWTDLDSTITSIGWSVDGVSIGAACYGGLHWFRPVEPNRKSKHFPWKGSLLSLELSPDGKWAASGCQDASVHIWRLWTGDDLQMSGYPSKIESVAWDPSSRFLAIGGVGDVTIWDFAGKGPQGTRPVSLDGHDRHISALSYSPSGSLLATCDASGRLIFWRNGKKTKKAAEHIFSSEISAVAWQENESSVTLGSADGTVRSIVTPPR
jgi:WD40 repeat protein